MVIPQEPDLGYWACTTMSAIFELKCCSQSLTVRQWHEERCVGFEKACVLLCLTFADVPHNVSKNACTSVRSTFLSMFAAYTVRPHSSLSSSVRGKYWLLTGTIAVLDGSTLRGYVPKTVPFLVSA